MNHSISRIVTGHDLLQPQPDLAPLEFDLTPGDAELVAACASGIDALRKKNADEAAKSQPGPSA
jgi:hypothetical protein